MTAGSEKLDANILVTLGELRKASDIIIRTMSEDREAAARYRTDIRNEVLALRNDYHTVKGDLRLIKEKVEEMKPKVEALERKDHRTEGARGFAVSVGSALAHVGQFIAGALGGSIAVLVEKWFHK